MATNYSIKTLIQIMDGALVNKTVSKVADSTYTQSFIMELTVAAAASDTSITLGGLTAPKVLIVLGADDISFKMDAGGTDIIDADPMAVICDETDGIGVSALLMSNGGATDRVVTIIALQ